MKISIKNYIDDPNLTWEEIYTRLAAHHKEETDWLISEVKRLEKLIVRNVEDDSGIQDPEPAY
jgi:hypothetical protein